MVFIDEFFLYKILINHLAETRFYRNLHSHEYVMNVVRESKPIEYNREIFLKGVNDYVSSIRGKGNKKSSWFIR